MNRASSPSTLRLTFCLACPAMLTPPHVHLFDWVIDCFMDCFGFMDFGFASFYEPFIFAHRIGFGFIVLDVVMDDGSTLIVLLLLLLLSVTSQQNPPVRD